MFTQGNPGGRLKKSLKPTKSVSVRESFIKIIKQNPELVEDAFIRGLESSRSNSFIELGAKLLKEIGSDETTPAVAIIFNSSLDPNKLKAGNIKIVELAEPAESELESKPKHALTPGPGAGSTESTES